jgi:hypothetical protein
MINSQSTPFIKKTEHAILAHKAQVNYVNALF